MEIEDADLLLVGDKEAEPQHRPFWVPLLMRV